MLKSKITIIDIDDKDANLSDSKKIGEHEYEQFLNTGDENYEWKKPKDEWQAISLGYTSGTTGNPKRCCLSSSRIVFNGNWKCSCLEYA